jgi:acyl-CoA hydrolase
VGTATTVFWQHLNVQWLVFGGFMLALAVMTGLILWSRREAAQTPQQGTLASVVE